MINIHNLKVSFGEKSVINGIDLEVQKGETFVIIGQSGIGKTVILRHIVGFFEPDKGDVFIDGEKMNGAQMKKKEMLRAKMGFLFQFGALLNWINVWDNVALPLTESGAMPQEAVMRHVAERLDDLQLSDAKEKFPADLSGGMKKRVGLARAMITNPEIILYDEPTTGLDPVMSSRISELILMMQKKYNVTSVVVTHDMKSAFHVADRIAMLYDGKIVQCGTPKEIRQSENPIVRQFINGTLHGPIPI